MSAAEVAAESGILEDVIVDKFGLPRAHRRGRRARQRPGRHRCLPAARGPPARSRRDRRGHVLRLDLEGLSSLASGPVDRAPARPPCARRRVRQRLDGHAGRASSRTRAPRGGAGSCAMCPWSRPAGSRTCSTTGTSARASCSTSATARLPGCWCRISAGTGCSRRTRSRTAHSRSR